MNTWNSMSSPLTSIKVDPQACALYALFFSPPPPLSSYTWCVAPGVPCMLPNIPPPQISWLLWRILCNYDKNHKGHFSHNIGSEMGNVFGEFAMSTGKCLQAFLASNITINRPRPAQNRNIITFSPLSTLKLILSKYLSYWFRVFICLHSSLD